MSGVEDTEVIDLVTFDKKSNTLILVMIETRDWDSSSSMYSELQDKLSNYIAYVESGQLFEKYPDYKKSKIAIHLDHKFEMSKFAKSVFLRMEAILSEYGIEVVANLLE